MSVNTLINVDGQDVYATPRQIEAITTLLEARKGGVASVVGYVPSSNWIESPVQNIQFISRFSYAKLRERKRLALESLSIADVRDSIKSEPKLAALTEGDARNVFHDRLNRELASIEKTDSGNRDDAHRQAHDRCYINLSEGVKVHLVTEKDDDGIMQPVLTNGRPTVASIMISAIFLNVKTVKEGKRKVVNSGPPVLMSKAIEKAIDKPGISYRTLSLKDDNFERLVIDHKAILPEGLSV